MKSEIPISFLLLSPFLLLLLFVVAAAVTCCCYCCYLLLLVWPDVFFPLCGPQILGTFRVNDSHWIVPCCCW